METPGIATALTESSKEWVENFLITTNVRRWLLLLQLMCGRS